MSHLEVTVPASLQGDVMGDLNARRGRVQGTETADDGEQTIIALVPTSETACATRSTCAHSPVVVAASRARHDHYDLLPQHLVDKVKKTAE